MKSMERKSCASRLHAMQRDFGLSDKDLKNAVRDITTPREVELPTFHEKITKAERRRRKLSELTKKQRKYKTVYWYLEEFLKPEYARKIYEKFADFKDMVDYAYEEAMGVVKACTFVIERDIDPFTIFEDTPDDELDIPEIQWEEFKVYCKKHPLKGGAKDIFERRKRFQKYTRKRRGRYYSKRRMRMYDPLFAMNDMNRKEMIKNLERITRENEQRVKKFHEMLGSLVQDKSIGAEAMRRFDKQTDELLKRHRKRMNQFMKQNGQKPTPITFDFDDEPSVTYDG